MRKQDLHQPWTTCSHLVAKSGLPSKVLAKHLPINVVAKIDELRFKSSMSRRSPFLAHHHHQHHQGGGGTDGMERRQHHQDSSDVELVKQMVMGDGLNLDEALTLYYAIENTARRSRLDLASGAIGVARDPGSDVEPAEDEGGAVPGTKAGRRR